ncbi:hypothetical protein SAMN02745121_08486 [Nannocystis exedens]|uniref:Uncharacterized protein n=1 Tax=Nannocystis exedens TaxID=54 RepID=A0A1I2I8W7_9BACT|nr:hypothetical protein [Nannocystis exedens]PCC74131.1 hypothetical protein NAEX_07220 [Nannocystis exedens]SFF38040.1 hypothetical protein SAMN02745121_08486 [Nannocystis exedens]
MEFRIEKCGAIDLARLGRNIGTGVVIRIDGRIDAGGGDNRLLARPNDAAGRYRGFASMSGDAATSEWEQTGLYLGRNGWGLDAHFSISLILSLLPDRKRTAFAISTFAHADERVLGYQSHGFWADTSTPINFIGFWTVGPGRAVLEARVDIPENP